MQQGDEIKFVKSSLYPLTKSVFGGYVNKYTAPDNKECDSPSLHSMSSMRNIGIGYSQLSQCKNEYQSFMNELGLPFEPSEAPVDAQSMNNLLNNE